MSSQLVETSPEQIILHLMTVPQHAFYTIINLRRSLCIVCPLVLNTLVWKCASTVQDAIISAADLIALGARPRTSV